MNVAMPYWAKWDYRTQVRYFNVCKKMVRASGYGTDAEIRKPEKPPKHLRIYFKHWYGTRAWRHEQKRLKRLRSK